MSDPSSAATEAAERRRLYLRAVLKLMAWVMLAAFLVAFCAV